jgi:RNA recognition motif-containing protein
MPIRLFVGNLPYDTSEAALKDHFATVAPVAYLTIPKDRETGRARNFAFVEFSERAQAEEAIRRFNNQLFNGRPLAVSEARPREEGRPTSATTRPPLSRPRSTAEPMAAPPPPSGDKPNRNFGPDAAPPRRGKGKGAPKSERASKGPMREVVRGQFVGGDDDDDYDDFDDDGYDYEDDNDGSTEEDFADHANGAEHKDDK